MTASHPYPGRLLRVDLTRRTVTEEVVDDAILRKYVGGTGIGGRILYDEVPPGVGWSSPENRLIMATGPMAGTRMHGSGTFSVVTKGALTEGGTSTQANGFFGAYLRQNGFIGLVFQGASDHWVYLHVHDGQAELRDAGHLVGKDTWETEDAIKKELGSGERQMSVFGIGPAGENLVKFAAIVGDHGHAAAHNGCGAVMGSKKLKAVAVARSKGVPVHDAERVSALAKRIYEGEMADPQGKADHEWGTSMSFPGLLSKGQLPVKNMTTNLFPQFEAFMGTNYRQTFEMKTTPCWACPHNHLHLMKVPSGPYAGYVGEEPEYECWAAWGPVIGNTDVFGAFVLSNEVDKLGMDTNEAGWLLAFAIDCFERGIINKADTDGIELTWGNVKSVRTMLHRVARRQGFGDVLADGVKRAAEKIGGEALKRAAYIKKGHAPRGHDHRARWSEILDYATSSMGTIETGPIRWVPPEFGMAPFTDPFSPEQTAEFVAKFKAKRQFIDCLGVCIRTIGPSYGTVIEIVNAATGWDLTVADSIEIAMRSSNLFRCFNIRHGIGTDVEAPSEHYSSVPVDGPAKGRDIRPHWERMLDLYYQHAGWDRKSGKPLPDTLRRLGLEKEIADLW